MQNVCGEERRISSKGHIRVKQNESSHVLYKSDALFMTHDTIYRLTGVNQKG